MAMENYVVAEDGIRHMTQAEIAERDRKAEEVMARALTGNHTDRFLGMHEGHPVFETDRDLSKEHAHPDVEELNAAIEAVGPFEVASGPVKSLRERILADEKDALTLLPERARMLGSGTLVAPAELLASVAHLSKEPIPAETQRTEERAAAAKDRAEELKATEFAQTSTYESLHNGIDAYTQTCTDIVKQAREEIGALETLMMADASEVKARIDALKESSAKLAGAAAMIRETAAKLKEHRVDRGLPVPVKS